MKINVKVLSHLLKTPIVDIDGFEKFLNERICEVDDRTGDVFNVKILPDRAADTMSYYGLAREYAAFANIPLKNLLSMLPNEHDYNTGNIKVTSDTSLCECMLAISATVPKTYNSFPHMAEVLSAAGQKSIYPLVDITNYMMFMYGNPVHVYDKDKMGGTMEIRKANTGEAMETLHGEPVLFKGGEIVITNGSEIISLAGIKGGKVAEINTGTDRVVFEMGVFNNSVMRKTTAEMGISTEASKRFVHPLPPVMPKYIALAFVGMLFDAGFTDITVNSFHEEIPRDRILNISWNRIDNLLGMGISKDHAMSTLCAVGFDVNELREDNAIVMPPWYRTDVDCMQVIADEIGRFYGYDLVRGQLCDFTNSIEIGNYYHRVLLKKELSAAGFSEIITYSFVKKGDVEVAYPMTRDKGALRTDIISLFSESLIKNKNHKDTCAIDLLSLFEVGITFTNDGEFEHICIGSESKKQMIEMTEKLDSTLSKYTFTKMNEKNSDGLYISEYRITYPTDSNNTDLVKLPELRGRAQSWSLYPAITRDISVWLPKWYDADALLSKLNDKAGELLMRAPRVVDTFMKDGKNSVLIRLVFQSPKRTLVGEEIELIMNAIYDLLLKEGIETR